MTANNRNDYEKSSSAQTVRVPIDLMRRIRHILVDAGTTFQGLILQLLEEEVNSTERRTPSDNSDIRTDKGNHPIFDVSKRTAETLASPLKQQGTSGWEHQYLQEILQSGHAIAKEAIRKNMIAFRELATGRRDESEPGQSPGDAGEELLSDPEMERIREQDRIARQLAEDAKGIATERAPGRKRRGPPKEGTGGGD